MCSSDLVSMMRLRAAVWFSTDDCRLVITDFAAETANLSRAQILQQAGNAMVAQANQLPQQVLSLLQR